MASVLVESPIARVWKPTKKQQEFISLPFTVFEGLYGGAAGAGKSEILLLLCLIYNFHEHPLFKGIILRRTFPELESEIILRSKEWYAPAGGTYNESKRRWSFPSGAIIQFGHAEREDDIRKYDTAQYNYIGFDEATSFTQFQYEYLSFTRCRSRCSDLPAIVRAATNPGNIGHAYFRDRFVTPWKTGSKLIVDNKTSPAMKRYFVHATVYDNPHIIDHNPQYVQQLQSLPEAERRAKLGDWYTYQGQVFKEFRLEPLKDEPDNAQHVIDEFEIPLWWPRVIAIDWGFTAYTWIGWFAISPEGRVYCYREYAEKEKKHDDWISDLINLTGQEKNSTEGIWICHSANQRKGEPDTILQKVSKAANNNEFHCKVGLGSKGRVNGKMNVHEYLRWEPKPDIRQFIKEDFDPIKADSIFRLYGEAAYKQYVEVYSIKEPEKNLPKLQIFRSCKKLTQAIPDCIYDDSNPEDVAEFTGDDPYDGLRIALDGIKDYIVKHAQELGKLTHKENAIKELSQGNQTAFYRRMEFLESKKQETGSIRRRRFNRFRALR